MIRASVSFISARFTTMSMMPCCNRYSARWKPSGSVSRTVCSITLRTGETDQRAGLGDLDVAQHGEGGGDAAGGGVGEDDDEGQAGVFDQPCGDDGARHLDQADGAFLHAGAAGGGEHDQRRFLQRSELRRRDDRLAQTGAHGAADEREIHRRDHRLVAADGAVADEHRVIQVGGLAGFFQAVGIAFGVAEFQRIGDCFGQFDAGVAVLVEDPVQALDGGAAVVVAAIGADLHVGHEVFGEDHALAAGALAPRDCRARHCGRTGRGVAGG